MNLLNLLAVLGAELDVYLKDTQNMGQTHKTGTHLLKGDTNIPVFS